MNWDTMLKVVMSMIFFAPLLIALVAFLVVGVLVAFEGIAALATKNAGVASPAKAASETAPGPIVAGLDEAISQEGQGRTAQSAKNADSKAGNS